MVNRFHFPARLWLIAHVFAVVTAVSPGAAAAALSAQALVASPGSGAAAAQLSLARLDVGHPTRPTLTPARLKQLDADGYSWVDAIHAWAKSVPHCRQSAPISSCIEPSFTAWKSRFDMAQHDARALASTVSGNCKTKLLDYLGVGGVGEALTTIMSGAEQNLIKGEIPQFNLTVAELVTPTVKTAIAALRTAANACYRS